MTESPSTDLPAPVTRVTAVPPAKGWTMFEENGQDEVGVVVDQRFEILARIGDGGMARVYACKDPGTRQRGRAEDVQGLCQAELSAGPDAMVHRASRGEFAL